MSNALESNLKYMLVFSNTIENEFDYFKSNQNEKTDIKIIYVTVNFDQNNKKNIGIKQ